MKTGWIQLAVMAASAVLALLTLDYLLHLVAAPKHLREVEHGVRDLRRGDPAVLVLGSSHARTFHAVGQELARRTGNAQTLVAVPVEAGKLFAYDWVLHNRLAPIIDERDGSGNLVRTRARQFVLVTEWWDSCAHDAPYWSLPGRAWVFGEFLEDLLQNGINGYNRNYLQNRFRVLLADSALVYDRTQQAVVSKLGRLVRGKPLGRSPEDERRLIGVWQRMVEEGAACIGDPVQRRSLERILAFARARSWKVTVVLFPRKPATLTEKAKVTTLAAFADQVGKWTEPYAAKVVDLTHRSPLRDADFMEDFDHVTEEGNRMFSRWVLDQDLRFLVAPAEEAGRVAAGH